MSQLPQPSQRSQSTVWDEEERMGAEYDAISCNPLNPCVPSADILRLIENTLNEADRLRVESHLASCPLCRGSLQGFREGLEGDPMPQLVPGSFLAELLADLQEAERAQKSRQHP